MSESRIAAIQVSVIVPAYNAADTIAETLESLLSQIYLNWEAIVVDDGSTDATADIVRGYVERDARIRMTMQANGGEAAARNAGIALARHDWLLFLDADDWISPLHLEQMTAALLSDPTLDAVHCGSARIALDGTFVIEKYVPPTGDMFSTLARRAAFPIHACIVRRALVESVGKFDRSLRTSPDWDMWQRIARTGAQFGSVRQVLALYRMSPRSASLNADQLLQDGLRVLRQGHAPDPRVNTPHPDHANGLPKEQIRTQEFYLLCWCAGLLLGRGEDARPLLEKLKEDNYPELYPEAVAQCIFESAPLSTCQPPCGWEQLWPKIEKYVEDFLLALESHSLAVNLARRATMSLKTMVLKHSQTWRSVIEGLEQTITRLEEERRDWQRLAEERAQAIDKQRSGLDELQQGYALLEEQHVQWQRLAEERAQTIEQQKVRLEAPVTTKRFLEERYVAVASTCSRLMSKSVLKPEYINALRTWTEKTIANPIHQLQIMRLRLERWSATIRRRRRIVATACWSFPIYSQTFVHQELTQLIRNGFAMRFFYSKLNSRNQLPSQFSPLWHARRKLILHPSVCERDYAYFEKRMPEKINMLVSMLSCAAGMPTQEVRGHYHFLQAFAFTRMVEAYQPDYLHSYFFYEGTLFTFVASYLLNIPRGVSCYADHMLKDYVLKVVPLHLEQCHLVVATSYRIKQELITIAPHIDPQRIIVKANAINAAHFPVVSPGEPDEAHPYRLISVCRIEPKKGLMYLVEAMRFLRDRNIKVEWHHLGGVDDGASSKKYAGELEARIKDLKLDGVVHLEGRKTELEIKAFFQRSHVFVAPFIETQYGDKDGIPTSLLEGMASGLPVVATDAGSMCEVVEDSQDGVLVPQRDALALANAIEALLVNPESRRHLGEQAADKIRRLFDVQVCEGIFHDRVRSILNMPR